MDTIQIEVTNACINECSNCTRFCGHQKPYFMKFDRFQKAVDSMEGFPKMVGMMGGEPLLHPQFEEFCDYMLSKFQRSQLGLWSCFPKGYEQYRTVICKTFGNIFLNDHTRPDILHAPILVSAEEVQPDPEDMWININECWVQNAWSASINPKGAFFCEIAAAMSLLFDGNSGWPVGKYWWKRTPKDFVEQMKEYCPKCGCAFPLKRRSSIDGADDISPKNLERLKGKSKKIDSGKYVLTDLKCFREPGQMAAYKDQDYRDRTAARYGIFLILNGNQFLSPHLMKTFDPKKEMKSLFQQYKEAYGE
jgi:hypothetical protein